MQTAIGIDLGATNIKGVLIDGNGSLLHQLTGETREHDQQHWKQAVAEMFKTLESKSAHHVNAFGLSAPGLADEHNQSIAFMPGRLAGLENFNWSDAIGKKIHVLNDAHAALMAEATFGAGKGMKHLVLLTLGSGVGGGILINGNLYQGLGQMAGHFGHSTIDASTHVQDVTNMPGSIEVAIGNVTVEARTHGHYHSTKSLVAAYERHDPFATWVWLSSVQKLAACVASSVNIVSPEAVILSGGITKAGDSLMKPLLSFLEKYEWRPGGKQTPVLLARFSDMAGAMGAAAFALSRSK